MINQYNERFSFCKINVWTYFILGEADKEKAKGKKKLWWRPWVDHASSRFSQSFYKYVNLTLISLTRMKAFPDLFVLCLI